MLWLRHDDSPAVLPLRVTVHPRTLSHSTSLQVRVDRREADVQQETECSAQFGSFDHLDVTVPAALAGRWEVEGPAVTRQTELERAARRRPAGPPQAGGRIDPVRPPPVPLPAPVRARACRPSRPRP